MPTYDYACDLCDHRFEEFQSITAKPLKKCPACGKSALKRLIGTGAGMIFKGSGFYITDYGKDGKKDQRPAAKSGDAGKPADTKPADTAAKPAETKAPASSGTSDK